MSTTVSHESPAKVGGGLNLFAGHPAGLPTLFFTEMWERFSYYGMRALLMLYMVALPAQGGLGFNTQDAGSLYGLYTMAVYLSGIPGGFVADKWLGRKMSILIGGIVIAIGHFTLAFASLATFYTGLGLIILGTGMLKPNMSTLLGTLYGENDHRRDSGFSIYYMGINVGATLAPLVCGFLAQHEAFKQFLISNHLDPNSSWHWGFGAAGVGMILGLIVFLLRSSTLEGYGGPPVKVSSAKDDKAEERPKVPFTSTEWKQLGAIAMLFVFNVLFWAIYEQGGTSLNLFADKLTECSVFGWQFPSSWFQMFSAVFVILLAPVFSWLWIKLGDKEPSSPTKFAFGLALQGIGISLMAPAAMLAAHGKVSPLWLIACYFFQVAGEMCLSPVGLSTVTKLAPLRILSMTMGCWFLSNSIANFIAGKVGGTFNANDTAALVHLFGGMGVASVVAVGIILLLRPLISKCMSGVH